MSEASPPVAVHPAATVVLLRDGSRGPEVLYLRRNTRLAFHGGAWVFPGGRIDPEDHPPEADVDAIAAARNAAVREAREEAGVTLEPTALVPFARWTTPESQPRRFLTWFFAAHIEGQEVQVDGGEIHEHRWSTPAEALSEQRSGAFELPPPTFVTTLRLEPFATAAAALDALGAGTPDVFEPRIQRIENGACSLYAGDAAYESGDLERAGARHRLWILAGGWRYERSA
ncbi:MAG: NUDIX domain-containing protein [Proteobacteria bacterium]|nr:NUDIX domain-containing protein [Pseudomonadota bacterium]